MDVDLDFLGLDVGLDFDPGLEFLGLVVGLDFNSGLDFLGLRFLGGSAFWKKLLREELGRDDFG